MIAREFHFHDGKKGAALAVRVIRKSLNDKIQKLLKDGTVLVRIKDEPEDLNKELIKFLSDELNIAQKRFDIVAGDEGDDKLLSILDIEPGELQDLIFSKIK